MCAVDSAGGMDLLERGQTIPPYRPKPHELAYLRGMDLHGAVAAMRSEASMSALDGMRASGYAVSFMDQGGPGDAARAAFDRLWALRADKGGLSARAALIGLEREVRGIPTSLHAFVDSGRGYVLHAAARPNSHNLEWMFDIRYEVMTHTPEGLVSAHGLLPTLARTFGGGTRIRLLANQRAWRKSLRSIAGMRLGRTSEDLADDFVHMLRRMVTVMDSAEAFAPSRTRWPIGRGI